MSDVVLISGSPTHPSRATAILDYAQAVFSQAGLSTELITVRDVPPADLVYANFESPELKKVQAQLEAARAVVVSTPVYKASYTGVLKALLDLMPQYALAGKVMLPLAVGGTLNHLLAIDFAMKPLFITMGACHVLQGVYLLSSQIQTPAPDQVQLDPEIEPRMQAALQEVITALQ